MFTARFVQCMRFLTLVGTLATFWSGVAFAEPGVPGFGGGLPPNIIPNLPKGPSYPGPGSLARRPEMRSRGTPEEQEAVSEAINSVADDLQRLDPYDPNYSEESEKLLRKISALICVYSKL